jgi:3-methyladenine DNA glycosylase/8-oxoguanine DNA glycosylase
VRAARIAFGPLDLERTLALHRLGLGDPTSSLDARRFVKAFHAGEGVVRVSLERDGDAVVAAAEGPAAGQVLAAWLPLLPPDDGYAAFAPEHPVVRRLHRRHGGLRVLPVPWLFDVACAAVLQQRVAFGDARTSWQRIARAHGERSELGLAWPSPARLAEVPGWELERLGLDPKRARALLTLAREEVRRPFLSASAATRAANASATPGSVGASAALRERLLSLRGVGPWTAGMVLGFGAGDPDAVLVGDLHVPHVVAWALAREPRASDARMLELLEPFRGQRFRVTRLLLGGAPAAPRLTPARG